MGQQKEDTQVHEKCIVHTAVFQKTPLGLKRYRTVKHSETIKPVALAIIELCYSEGIGQAGRCYIPTVLEYHTIKQKHSRDITILIVLLWFNIVYYSSLFHYFIDQLSSLL